MSSNIPDGFTEESWNALTPEQQQVYLNAQNQNTAAADDDDDSKPSKKEAIMNEAGDMVKQAAKWSLYSAIMGLFSGLFYRLFGIISDHDE